MSDLLRALVALLLLPMAATAQLVQLAKQRAEAPSSYAFFGKSVAVSDDWEIVGSPGENGNAGAAYLFTRNDPFNAVARLEATTPTADASFGYRVAIRGDWAIVGAPGEEGNKGAAYVFRKVGTVWNQTPVQRLPGEASGDLFGNSVSIGDGWALVGAPIHYEGIYKWGAAYVYEYDSGTWVLEKKLTSDAPQHGGLFGHAVSITAGGERALVGAYKEREASSGKVTGAAYFFERDTNGAWKLTPQRFVGTPNKMLGLSVSITDDWAIVGEWGGNSDPTASGAAHVFEWTSGAWALKSTLPGAPNGDNFGYSVSISPDAERALVGETGDDLCEANAGAAYLFESNNGAWDRPSLRLQACDPGVDDQFGISVAAGNDWAVVGAYRHEETGPGNTGAAYVFGADPGIVTYCTAKTGTVCGPALIGHNGTPRVGNPEEFRVFAAPVRANKPGWLKYSLCGRQTPALPFKGGFLCLREEIYGSVTVLSGGGSGCTGEFSFDFNAFANGDTVDGCIICPNGPGNKALQVPGTRVNVQWFGRDSVATGLVISDALEFTMMP